MENPKMQSERSNGMLRFLGKLKDSTSGLALTEFAFSLPIFMGLGLYGVEISNLAITNMHLSQAALHLADNASRLGQTNSGIATPVITESDIVRSFQGTSFQTANINLLQNGRVILSSLELDSNNNQLIRWQRCKGIKNTVSNYGTEGLNGTADPSFTGLGRSGAEVTAPFGSAIMFVELEYDFEGLFGSTFLEPRTIRQEAAFNIRDDRNLEAGLADDDGPNAVCTTFDDSF